MKRRKFLIGAGGTALGGSALLGTGAFTRVESHRRVKVEVAKDTDAYLGLDGCSNSPNASYTNIDSDGHLEIDMSSSNPTEAGGEGVNSDSYTWFDNLFQVCNNGKQPVGFWIDAAARELENNVADVPYDADERVIFYNTDNPDARVDSRENAYVLDPGQCKCIGMRVITKGLSKGDQLIEDDQITIRADADVSGTPAVPAENFTTMGRVRDGGTGWQVAVADPTGAGVPGDIAINDATGDWDPVPGESYSFTFGFDGTDTYSLTVEDEAGDEQTGVSASGLGVIEANSQFRLRLRGSADGTVELTSGQLNDVNLGTLRDDDESFPTVTIASEDLSEAFTVTGEFVFESIALDERPAIDIQVEQQ